MTIKSNTSVVVKNCNNIQIATMGIRKESLNIKYGPNGTGKSTISRAIHAQVNIDADPQGLDNLTPFGTPGDKPTVSGVDDITSVMIFDDRYVANFDIHQNEVIKNSFDIFMNTPEYQTSLDAYESTFNSLKESINNNTSLTNAIDDFRTLLKAFKFNKDGKTISKSSSAGKALSSGRSINEVPPSLKHYMPFISHPSRVEWITWQGSGNKFIEETSIHSCPFCAQGSISKDVIKQVSQTYESSDIKHLDEIRRTLDSLSPYLSTGAATAIKKITESTLELTDKDMEFLGHVVVEIEGMLDNLNRIIELPQSSKEEVSTLKERIEESIIEEGKFTILASEKTLEVIENINTILKVYSKDISVVRDRLLDHTRVVDGLVSKNQNGINKFLQSAGYKYKAVIDNSDTRDGYIAKLQHDSQGEGESVKTPYAHLSYGERNAFALIMFVYEVISKQPDLVILDDPVSSFDKTKKSAILNRLFIDKKDSLRGRTVLLMTHDLEPAIDIVSVLSDRYEALNPSADFLSLSNHVITETPIEKSDILTLTDVSKNRAKKAKNPIVKLVALRRYYESIDSKGVEYEALSSLLHRRAKPSRKNTEDPKNPHYVEIKKSELEGSSITTFITDFDYQKLLKQMNDLGFLKQSFDEADSGYDKLQIFRIAIEGYNKGTHKEYPAFMKFVNETYHIENDYFMQLDPSKFDTVPEHIVSTAKDILHKIGEEDFRIANQTIRSIQISGVS